MENNSTMSSGQSEKSSKSEKQAVEENVKNKENRVDKNKDRCQKDSLMVENVSNARMTTGRCSSELDLRAASVRSQIEQKIVEIEAGLHLQLKSSESSNNHVCDFTPESEMFNMRLSDVKRSKSYSAEKKDIAIARLQEELDKAQQALKLKDEEVLKLAKVRDGVGAEIEELTASLFEEANKMVQDAYRKQMMYQKEAKEANMSLSVLQEEVVALKALFKSSLFYQRPCATVHRIPSKSVNSSSSVSAQSQLCTSFEDLQSAHETDMPKRSAPVLCSNYKRGQYETDPTFYDEFIAWRKNPIIDKEHKFFQRLYEEDINPSVNFKNTLLAEKVLDAIENKKIAVELIPKNQPFPKKCALLDVPRFCQYRMNLGGDESYSISSFCRNRIIAICNLFCYLRYIERGLVTDSVHEAYLEILKLRKGVAVARLGLPEEQYVDTLIVQ